MTTKNVAPDLEEVEKDLNNIKIRFTRNMFHLATPQHGNKLRGVGITRKSKVKTPAQRKQAKLSRRKNR